VQPIIRTASLFNRGLLPEDFILQRHRLIDHLLREAVENRGIRTIVEIASGMSPRGYRFKREFGGKVVYIEADLPDMAATKREVLEKAGLPPESQRVVAVDVTKDSGPLNMEEAIRPLLEAGPAAIITEGLVNYFPRDAVMKMWSRFADLAPSPGSLYLTDLHTESATPTDVFARAWRGSLHLFTRGKTYLHFKDGDDAERALMDAGFQHARLHDPQDYADSLALQETGRASVVHVLEGRFGPA